LLALFETVGGITSRLMLVQMDCLLLTSKNGTDQISSYGIRTKPK
jgi:hypothetical protein